jgi:uncharacterized membrane protein YqiK
MTTRLVDQLNEQFKTGQAERKQSRAKAKAEADSQLNEQRRALRESFKQAIALLPNYLKEAARKGAKVITANSFAIYDPDKAGAGESEKIYGELLAAFANEHGLQCSRVPTFQPYSRGDPDSGEGRQDEHWLVEYTLQW